MLRQGGSRVGIDVGLDGSRRSTWAQSLPDLPRQRRLLRGPIHGVRATAGGWLRHRFVSALLLGAAVLGLLTAAAGDAAAMVGMAGDARVPGMIRRADHLSKYGRP